MNLLQYFGRLEFISPRQRKKLIWKWCSRSSFQDHGFCSDFYGFKYRGHTQNHIDRFVYFLGAYEKGMLKFIETSLKESQSKVFVDIGANVGHHTLFASKFASQVYSFEPYYKVRNELEKKIADNNLINVNLSQYAIGLKNEELTYFEPGDHNTGTGSFVDGFDANNTNKGLQLSVRNGSELFSEMGINDIAVMKVDVEGFEANVLESLLPVLKKTKPIIILEFIGDTKKAFSERPELVLFLKESYSAKMFNNSNKINYKFLPWDFDRFGDVVFFPK
ncbi:FkbM family methyltransferase [Peredibacter starrii]|uniref:FkbM family methyltransferase n=1 Tax=Peredibacter starrii TaxID=28202 RepID=A0AAX4HRF7_9BACT|nr:FkbM family methyltransferase [Peredibacter starrii]WPU65812.1 FkbM family methyltransferase [Peredibacter starrii]